MRILFVLVAAVGLSSAAGLAAAQTAPADTMIKGVQYDIRKIEQQIKSLTPSRGASIKRVSRSLTIAEKRLQSSRNKDHPSWREAATRLAALKRQLANLGAGRAPTGAKAQAPKVPPARQLAGADPATGRAVREIKLLKRQISGQRSISARGAKRHLAELHRIGTYLAAIKDRTHPSWKTAAAEYWSLQKTLVDINLKILNQDYRHVVARIDKMTPTQYMLAKRVDPVRKSLISILKSAKALRARKNPGVKKLIADLIDTSDGFEARVKTALADRQNLGDVPARLAQIKQRIHRIKVPQLTTVPVTDAQIRDFTKAMDAVKQHIESDSAFLASIEGKFPLTVDQRNTFRFAKSSLQFDKPKNLKQTVARATSTIDLWVVQQERFLDFIEKTDPNDRNHRANRLLNKGSYEENLEQLQKAREAVKTAALFDKEAHRADAPDRDAQLTRAQAAIDAFKGKFTSALSGMRMPAAKSTSPKLLKVAAGVLSEPKHGHKYERVVINSDIRRQSKKTGDIHRGTVTSTITVYTYQWDQFQAITAEKVGDAYYLYANTFKHYYSGGTTTPLNRWILSGRFQSSRILKENIAK